MLKFNIPGIDHEHNETLHDDDPGPVVR